MIQGVEPTSKQRRGKSKDPSALREELLKAYRDMVLIRRFEERAGQLYGMGLIGGFCHLYIGQEAVVVGMHMCLKPGDQVITSYRDHGHMLATGMEARGVMAELTGRATGYSKGKGGSMHMFSVEKGFFGGHGIVGAQVSIGTGLGFKHKYADDGGLALVYFGDGAANQGQVYESFNMAELWKLPVIFVIENNQYAMGTSVNRASAEDQLYRRGESFRIPGIQVDGMDVLAVRGAAETARLLFLDLAGFDAWLARWRALGPDGAAMDRVNPLYIPRNHLVEEALEAARKDDLEPFEALLAAVRDPFTERPGLERYAEPAPAGFIGHTNRIGVVVVVSGACAL